MRTPLSRSKFYLATTVLGFAGVLTPFLPFYELFGSDSPLDAVRAVVGFTDDFWIGLLGAPFFGAIPISAASLRWIYFGQPSKSELGIAFGSALVAVLATLAATVEISQSVTDSTGKRLVVALPFLILALTGTFVWRLWRSQLPCLPTAVAAMQFAYCANALICLLVCWGVWVIGAVVTLFTVVVYALQLLLLLQTESGHA